MENEWDAECSLRRCTSGHGALSSTPFNRTNHSRFFGKVTVLANVDQAESASGVDADLNFGSGWEAFLWAIGLQRLAEDHRIIPNLMGAVLLFSAPVDDGTSASAFEADDFSLG